MSKLAATAPSMTPLTMCPGTLAYMPPEALNEPPVYTKKLDCFSEGVMIIQVCTRLWPESGPRTKTVEDPRSPTGRMQMPVLEPERRKNHIDMIDHSHGLLPVAIDCLSYQDNERPSSEELCQRLAGLKETREYRESVEQVERVQNDIAELERQMGEMQVKEAATVQQLHELCAENQEERQRYQSEIQHLESEIQSKTIQLKQQDEQHRAHVLNLKQMMEEQEKVTAEIQQAYISLQSQVEQLQQLLCEQQAQQNTKPSQSPPPIPPRSQIRGRQLQQDHSVKEKQPQPSPQQKHHQEPCPSMKWIKFGEWRDGGRTPYKMSRGAAVVDGDVAYFMNWNGQTCSYDKSKQGWSQLPRCPCKDCTLVVIQGVLTAIGASKGGHIDNKLLSIVNDLDKEWMQVFPPMPTKRSHTAAVTTKQHLIVAGGGNGLYRLDIVEVMDIESLVWSTAASLPHPYAWASATTCGDQLYMLGGLDIPDHGRSKSVLTCSLTKLLQSYSGMSSDSVWHRIADVPVYCSTCAAVSGELVAVGGEDAEYRNKSAIYKYHSTTDSWDIISNMPTARRYPLVVVFPTNEMMVVGGYLDVLLQRSDRIETVGIQCT